MGTTPWNIVCDQPDKVLRIYEALQKVTHPRQLPPPRFSKEQNLTFEWYRDGLHLVLEEDPQGYLMWTYQDIVKQFFVSNDYPMSYRSLDLIREYLLPFAT